MGWCLRLRDCLLCTKRVCGNRARLSPADSPTFCCRLTNSHESVCHPVKGLFARYKRQQILSLVHFSALQILPDPERVTSYHTSSPTKQPENRYANTHVCIRSVAQCAYTKPASVNRWIVSYIHRDCPTTKVECCNTSGHRGESEGRTRWRSHQNVS